MNKRIALWVCVTGLGVAGLAAGVATGKEPAVEYCGVRAMDWKPMTCRQEKPVPVNKVSASVQERNKQLIIDVYQKFFRAKAYTAENAAKYFAPDFVQHDQTESSTAEGFAAMWSAVGGTPPTAPRTALNGPFAKFADQPWFRDLPLDSEGNAINYTFADGDFVIVMRPLPTSWPGGPSTLWQAWFTDVWRVQNGRITDQWCSCLTPPAAGTQGPLRLAPGSLEKFQALREELMKKREAGR